MSDVDTVRLLVGDTDSGAEILADADITTLLSTRAVLDTAGGTVYNVVAAAADAAGAIAAKYASQFDFAEDGQSFSRSQRVAHFREIERSLRNRSGVTSVPVSLAGTAIAS